MSATKSRVTHPAHTRSRVTHPADISRVTHPADISRVTHPATDRKPIASHKDGTLVKDDKQSMKFDLGENVNMSRSLTHQRHRPSQQTLQLSKTKFVDAGKATQKKPPKPAKSEQTLLRSLELAKENGVHRNIQSAVTVHHSLINKSRSHSQLNRIKPLNDHNEINASDQDTDLHILPVEGAKGGQSSQDLAQSVAQPVAQSSWLHKKCADQINKIDDVIQSLSKRIDYLESLCTADPPSFTVCIPYGVMAPIATGCIITSFNDVISNTGEHFDPVKGEFTAPKDAVYVIGVTIKQAGEGYINVDVIWHPRRLKGRTENRVCTVRTAADMENASCMGVVKLEADDQLYLTGIQRGSARLNMFSSFSCFALK